METHNAKAQRLLTVITHTMPVSEARRLYHNRFDRDMFVEFGVKNIKELTKAFSSHFRKIKLSKSKSMGYKEVLVEPIAAKASSKTVSVPKKVKEDSMKGKASRIAPVASRLETIERANVSFADVSNEDYCCSLDEAAFPLKQLNSNKESLLPTNRDDDEDNFSTATYEKSEDSPVAMTAVNAMIATLSVNQGEGINRPIHNEDMCNFFYQKQTDIGYTLVDAKGILLGESSLDILLQQRQRALDYGLLGRIYRLPASCTTNEDNIVENKVVELQHKTLKPADQSIFLNVTHPFCLVCVGVQGAGKSHTMNTVLENCLVPCPVPSPHPVTSLRQSMCGLVFHYDQSVNNVCEATGLRSIDAQVTSRFGLSQNHGVGGVKRMVILVSPSYYKQRKYFYRDQDFEVRPLLFKWSSLGAQQLKKLMRLNENDSQLYVTVMLDLLRRYQRNEAIPVFQDFVNEVKSVCKVQGQSGPLDQRLQLLQSVMKESISNTDIVHEQVDLVDLMESGTLVVADLTDPLLSPDEANGIFQVLLEQFRNHHLPSGVGRVVAFDEAHKYLCSSGQSGSGGGGKDGLSISFVNTVRLMRHEGIRILISTQSPLALPHELLELVSVTVAHHFQSHDWYKFLSSKIPMPSDGFSLVKKLKVGEALVVCTKMCYTNDESDEDTNLNGESILLRIRPRITSNYGSSKVTK